MLQAEELNVDSLKQALKIEKKELQLQNKAIKQRRKELKKQEKKTKQKDLAAYEQLKQDQIALAEAWFEWEMKKEKLKKKI